MVHKRHSNKLIEDLASLSRVLIIKPVSELLMGIENPAQDGLAEIKEASLAGYIQTKHLRNAALFPGSKSIQTLNSYTGTGPSGAG